MKSGVKISMRTHLDYEDQIKEDRVRTQHGALLNKEEFHALL